VRLLLVEDDELFRLGLRVRLQQETEIEIVAEAIDGETAVELTNQYLPDVILLDVGLPGIGGIEACRQIKQQHPTIPIFILTSHSAKPLLESLIAAGANGYCLKGVEADTLILALKSIVAGASWWDAVGTAEIRQAITNIPDRQSRRSDRVSAAFGDRDNCAEKTQEKEENRLTQRELEILSHIVAGKSNQEIAEELQIAIGTVRVHVHAILQKLEVRDRTQAAILAIEKGLL
jgi:two-component system, NarL family, response regulator